jgi:putative transposase
MKLKDWAMKSDRSRYCGYRFPLEIISYAVWAYHRFCLSFRDVEDLLAEWTIIVSYETIRQWCQKFGADYARKLKRREGRLGDHRHLDEVFIRINGQQQYLWRAVDQDGDVIESCFNRIVISAPQNHSFEDCCAAKVPNRCGSLPTN